MTELMLANRAREADIDDLQAQGYVFDLKIDGIRCLASVTDGVCSLRSRRGEQIANRYPEVTEALSARFPQGHWVFDGELAVNNERGLPSWPLTQKRIGRSPRQTERSRVQLPITFYVFDLLEAGTNSLATLAYAHRRQALEWQFSASDPGVLKPVLHSADGRALWSLVVEHRLEGMVAKRPTAGYRPGRSADWVKVKRTSTISCLVGGTDMGVGSRRSTFGALHLYLLDGDQVLTPVGKVGSGFSERELVSVTSALRSPPLIVEIEYLDVTPDGQLRQPVFQRVRDDLTITDCSTEQLSEGSRT